MPQQEGKFKHSGKHFLLNGRWHKLHDDKPVPKGAPVAAHPHAAGQHAPAKHFTDDEWAQLKLPESNVNAGHYNGQLDKLKQMSEAGHVTGILGHSFGTNTYGKKLAKVANHLLGLHGSQHQVAPGQKAGEHQAVQAGPAEPSAPQAPSLPPHLANLADKMDAATDPQATVTDVTPEGYGPGDDAPKDGDTKQGADGTLTFKDGRWHKEAKADAPEPAEAQPEPTTTPTITMPTFQEGKTVTGVVQHYEKVAQQVMDLAANGDMVGLEQMKKQGLTPSAKTGKVSNTWAGKTANSKLILGLHAKAMEQTKGGAAPSAPGLPDGWNGSVGGVATKPGIEGGIVDKNKSTGHPFSGKWFAIAHDLKLSSHFKDKWFDTQDEAIQALADAVKAGPKTKATRLVLPTKPSTPAPAAPKASPDTGPLTADQLGKLQSIPWHKLKLPDTNTNAASVNKKLKALQEAAFAGDVDAIEAMKWGSNNYNKKLELAAKTAVAALKEGGAHAASAPPEVTPAQEADLVATKVAGKVLSAEQAATWSKLTDDQKSYLIEKVEQQSAPPTAAKTAQPTPAEPKTLTAPKTTLHNTQPGHSKSWSVYVTPNASGGYAMFTEYGKIGGHQQKTVKLFTTSEAAHAAALKLTNAKKAKGYAHASTDYAHKAVVHGATTNDTPPSAASDGPPKKPDVLGSTWSGAADKIELAMKAGDTAALNMHLQASTGLVSDASKTVAAYAQAALDHVKGKGGAAPAPVDASEHPLVDQWVAALSAGKPPTKEQAEAYENLVDSDPDAAMEKFMDAANSHIAPEDMNDDLAFDGALEAAHNKVHALHAQALNGQAPAAAAKIKIKGVEYTKEDDSSWSSSHGGTAQPNSLLGFALEIASGASPDLSGKSDAQKEWIAEQVANAGSTPEHALSKVFAAGPKGPKEGDTKEINGVTYQLINGRWHKVSDDEPAQQAAAAHPVDAIKHPDFVAMDPTGMWGKHYAKLAEHLKGLVKAHGADGLKGVVISHADGSFTIKALGFNLKKIKPMEYPLASQAVMAARWAAMHQLVTDLKAVASAPTKTKAKAAPTKPAAAPFAAAAPQIEAMDDWLQTGGQGGSNPGGKFKDKAGQDWYCKFPADADIAKSEILAAKLYAIAGLTGQDAKLITKGGKVGIASKWMDLKKVDAKALATAPGAASGFAVDAWLGNWDVVGLGFDNLMLGADGKAVRVDAGGSLEYRAQGAKKPFGPVVDEMETLRDKAKNPQSAAVFGKLTAADITASVAKVLAISDAQIRAAVAEHGPGDAASKKALADTLIARKNDLAAKYPKAVKTTAKKALDPKALPIKPEDLPKRHDFANWKGKGDGLSSKPHVNAANQAVEDQMYALAKTGNLVDLKSFHFQPLDKDTGAPSGPSIPVAKHPSKHVQQLHADLVLALEEVANPPEPLKVFRETEVSTLEGLSAAFPSKAFGTTVHKVSSNEKLGFWVALGAVAGAQKFAPTKNLAFSTSAIKAAKDNYAKASKLAKHFINSVQASGSYNDLFRNGAEKDHQGNLLSDVAKAAEEYAVSQPEGTSVYRWQNMSDEMVKKMMGVKDGTVIQATGPMCTSYSDTATQGFGEHRVTIRYAKGAKAVESFGSGGYAGEKEVTTLPNSRFVVLSKKMVPGKSGTKQRLELELLMLPPDLGL